MAPEVAGFEKIIPNNQGWDVLWQVSPMQGAFWILGIVCGALRRLKKKRKRGIHLIVRVKDLKKKNTRGCPFLFSKRAFVPPGKEKANGCRTTGVVLRVTKNNSRLCLKT